MLRNNGWPTEANAVGSCLAPRQAADTEKGVMQLSQESGQQGLGWVTHGAVEEGIW